MLNAKTFSNAVTTVTAIFYVGCLLLTLVLPNVIIGVAQSWVHGLNLDVLKGGPAFSWASAAAGLVTISLLAWITTYATIALYNIWSQASLRADR